MALQIGTSKEYLPMNAGSVGSLHKTEGMLEAVSGWWEFLRIGLTVAEIGAAISGIGWLAEGALGVASAAVNTGIDAATGHLSAVGIGVNFGSAFGGAGFARRIANKTIKSLPGIAKDLTKSGIGEWAVRVVENGKNIDVPVASAGQWLNKALPNFHANYTPWKSVKSQLADVIGTKLRSKGMSGVELVDEAIKEIKKDILSTTHRAVATFGAKSTDNAARIARNEKEQYEVKQYLETLGLTESEIARFLKIWTEAGTSQVEATLALGELNSFMRSLSTKGRPNLNKFVMSFENMTTKVSLAKIDDIATAETILYRALEDSFAEVGLELLNKPTGSVIKRLWKYIGTRHFNDKWVQRLQLIDPNDAGRAPVEKAYQFLKSKINKWFDKIEMDFKAVKKAEEAFIKAGGITVSSEWIQGYKLIEDTGMKKLIMISFKPHMTNHKRPVLVWASPMQFKKLITESPGRTYQKYWAASKGGKAIGLTNLFGGLSFAGGNKMIMHSVFSFIPVQQLRNILSIVSNYVENFSDISKGTYFKNYFKKLTRSMSNVAISRSFRLAGRVGLGRAVGHYFNERAGKFAGALAQKIGTNVFAAGIKNSINGKQFLTSKQLLKASLRVAAITTRTTAKRKLVRQKGNSSAINNILSGNRKLRQANRLPNALMPGRPYKGLSIKW